MKNLDKEVAMMFVRNCPDSPLSIVFMSKLVESWTVKEVQERMDEYHRELKFRPSKHSFNRQARQAVAVTADNQTLRVTLGQCCRNVPEK